MSREAPLRQPAVEGGQPGPGRPAVVRDRRREDLRDGAHGGGGAAELPP